MLEALAYAYHTQNQDGKAVEVYRRILADSPENTGARYNLATLLWRMGEKDDALRQFQLLLDQTPDDLQALFQEGKLLLELGKAQESVSALERYLQERPEDVPAYMLLGDGYRLLERYDRALQAYSNALTHNEKLPEAWFYSALIYLTKIEDPERGLTALDQALGYGFKDPEKISALFDSPELLEKEKVRKLLEDRGVLPEAKAPAPQ